MSPPNSNIEDEMNIELNEDDIDNEVDTKNVEDEIKNETNTTNVAEKIEEPKVGMTFNSIDEIYVYYSSHARGNGFVVARRTSKKGTDGKKKWITVACSHTGKSRIKTNNLVRL
ncbi:hypothetical protein ACSBR2_001825 [Camellia fascicularis]